MLHALLINWQHFPHGLGIGWWHHHHLFVPRWPIKFPPPSICTPGGVCTD